MLTGCGQKEEGSASAFSYIYDSGENSSNTIESSSAAGNSSAAGSSSAAGNSSTTGNSSADTSEPAVIWLPEELEPGTVYYCKDPRNPVTVTYEDSCIVVKTKGTGFAGPMKNYPEMNITQELDGDETVYTLTPAGRLHTGIGLFGIIDKHSYIGDVYFAYSDGKITEPEFGKLAENNRKVLESVTDSSEARVAQAITLDGSRERIPQIWSEIEKLSNEICNGIDDDYEKLRAIADWVSTNIYYDRPAVRQGEPPSCTSLEYMLNNRSSICGGYANMTAALCNAQGIRCISIVGKALIDGQTYLTSSLEGSLHEWNVVEIDGRQIIVDVGWMSLNNLSYNNVYTQKDNSWKWFDAGEEIFATDHQAKTAEYKDFQLVAGLIAASS